MLDYSKSLRIDLPVFYNEYICDIVKGENVEKWRFQLGMGFAYIVGSGKNIVDIKIRRECMYENKNCMRSNQIGIRR